MILPPRARAAIDAILQLYAASMAQELDAMDDAERAYVAQTPYTGGLGLPQGVDPKDPAGILQDLVRARTATYQDRLRDGDPELAWLGDHTKEIGAQIYQMIGAGTNPRVIADDIAKLIGDQEWVWASTVARTESSRIRNDARAAKFEAQGVEMVEFVAAPDDRMCEECGSLHGKVFQLGSEPQLPIHPNCRCVYVPYYGGSIDAAADRIVDMSTRRTGGGGNPK